MACRAQTPAASRTRVGYLPLGNQPRCLESLPRATVILHQSKMTEALDVVIHRVILGIDDDIAPVVAWLDSGGDPNDFWRKCSSHFLFIKRCKATT